VEKKRAVRVEVRVLPVLLVRPLVPSGLLAPMKKKKREKKKKKKTPLARAGFLLPMKRYGCV
jgi:hypothetical protein